MEGLGQTAGDLAVHQHRTLFLGLAELGLEFLHLAGELAEVELRRGAVGLGLNRGLVLGGLGLGARLLVCGALLLELLTQTGDFAALPGGGVARPDAESEFFLERGLGLLGRRQGRGLGQPGFGSLTDPIARVLQRGQGDLPAAETSHQRGAVFGDGIRREGAQEGGGGGATLQTLGQGLVVGLEARTIMRGKRGADDPVLGILTKAGAQRLGGRGKVSQRRTAERLQEGFEGLAQIVLGKDDGCGVAHKGLRRKMTRPSAERRQRAPPASRKGRAWLSWRR